VIQSGWLSAGDFGGIGGAASYGYDDNSNPTTVNTAATTGVEDTYGYDRANRMTAATVRQATTTALTSATGALLGTASYTPYGTTATVTGAATPIGWAGEYRDTETGLTYLRARYYDPTTGQFLTRDPLEATTRDPYGYAGGNPTNMTDPTGLCWGPTCIVEDIAGAIDDAWDASGGRAVSFVNDHTRTVGLCGQLSIGFGPYVSLQGCAAIDRHLDLAIVASADASAGSPTISSGVGPLFSNARHVGDLSGGYAVGGGSVGEGVTGGFDVARGSDCAGRSVTTFYPTLGVGLEGLPGFEGHWGTGRSAVVGTGPASCSPRSTC
jgi:RHS repeat-associated protein